MMDATILDPETLTSLRELGDGDDAFVADLLNTWLEQADDLVKRLRIALTERNGRDFASAAHALAGSSLNVGAAGVAAACRRIEKSIGEGGAPTAAALADVERCVGEAAVAIHSKLTAN